MNETDPPAIFYEKVYESEFLDLYCASNGVLYADWIGNISHEQLVEGCEALLDSACQNECWKLLNDNRRLNSSWADSFEWMIKDFLPRFVEKGFQKGALIYSGKVPLFMDINKLFEMELPVEAQLFKDFESASEWLSGDVMEPPRIHDRFTFRTSDGYKQFSAEKIYFFTRFDGQTLVQTTDEQITIRMSLSELEQELPHDTFMRVHKSYIVNLDLIDKLEYEAGGYYRAYFKDFGKAYVTVSKNHVKTLKSKLGWDKGKKQLS